MSNFFLMKLFAPDVGRVLSSSEPQAAFAELAQRCPVHRAPDGAVVVTRLAEVTDITTRRDVRGPGGLGPSMMAARPLPPLDVDGAEYLHYRRLLDPLFSARKVAELEPAVRELADQLIDGFIAAGAADAQAAFCHPLAARFFLRLMGLPPGDLDYVVSFKDIILGHDPALGRSFPERVAKQRAASREFYRYLDGFLDDRAARGDPGAGLLGQLATAEIEGQRLSRDNILDVTYVLLLAGLDTVAASLGCILVRLARDPALRRRLIAQPDLWRPAIDELLRVESPVQFGVRVPTTDLEIAGETVRAGTAVYVCWSSANLDAARFDEPLAVDLTRRPNPHVAFGSGFHKCLGLHLARMEIRAALEALHRRIPEYTLDGEPAYHGMPRTPSQLMLRWR